MNNLNTYLLLEYAKAGQSIVFLSHPRSRMTLVHIGRGTAIYATIPNKPQHLDGINYLPYFN